jgi:predicted GIY-YIG superfamily endonuclease
MVHIYILELEEGKYYVGKTNHIDFRLDDHREGTGSVWTSKYRPIKLIVKFEGDDFDEDKYTIKYMKEYGIDNVRGGSFCQINLSEEVRALLERMIKGATDKCYRCGEEGHFVRNCKKPMCYRCKKIGHYANRCPTLPSREPSSSEDEDEIQPKKSSVKFTEPPKVEPIIDLPKLISEGTKTCCIM